MSIETVSFSTFHLHNSFTNWWIAVKTVAWVFQFLITSGGHKIFSVLLPVVSAYSYLILSHIIFCSTSSGTATDFVVSNSSRGTLPAMYPKLAKFVLQIFVTQQWTTGLREGETGVDAVQPTFYFCFPNRQSECPILRNSGTRDA